MIIVDANPEFSTAYFEIGSYEGEFDEEGVIEIQTDCDCRALATTCLTIDQLQELLDEAKKFRTLRSESQ